MGFFFKLAGKTKHGFEIAGNRNRNSKRLKDKSKGNGFEFKITLV